MTLTLMADENKRAEKTVAELLFPELPRSNSGFI